MELEITAVELEITTVELEMKKKKEPNHGEGDCRRAAEAKSAKRWIGRARGGPPEGWSSKTAPDDHGCGVPSPEKDPCAPTRRRVDGKLPEKGGA